MCVVFQYGLTLFTCCTLALQSAWERAPERENAGAGVAGLLGCSVFTSAADGFGSFI